MEKLGGRDASYEEFLTDLQAAGEGECRYGLYDFEYEHQCQVRVGWELDQPGVQSLVSGDHRELQEAEAVPDVLVPRLGQNQEENVVRQLFRDIEKVLGELR